MDEKKVMKDLRQIRNLLILIALKLGATATETGEITGIGYSNISAMLTQRSKKKNKA
jgi:hypothetical protein